MRKNYKRGIVIMLVLAMLLFAACGAPNDGKGEESTSTEETQVTTTDNDTADSTESTSDVSDYIAESLTVLEEVFGEGGEQAGEGMEFNLGMLLAMTGDGEFYGKQMSRGAQLAAEQIKALGGPEINVCIADHESGILTAGVSGTRKLIDQDGVSAILSSYGAVTEAIIPLIQQSEVLTFNGGGASPTQLNQDYLWMTRMLFGYDPAPGAIDWLIETYPEAKKLAVIGTNENAIEVWEEMIPQIWPERSGGEVVLSEIVNLGITDWSQTITKIKASGADAIFSMITSNDLGYLVKQLREANVEIPIVGIEITDEAKVVAGDLIDTYCFATDYFDINNDNPFTKQFVDAYMAKYGEAPEFYAATYYENVFLVWDCIKQVIADGGDINSGADLQDALVKLNTFKSVYGGGADEVGTLTFDTEVHTCSKPMGVYKLVDGEPELLKIITKDPEW